MLEISIKIEIVKSIRENNISINIIDRTPKGVNNLQEKYNNVLAQLTEKDNRVKELEEKYNELNNTVSLLKQMI